MAIKKEQQKIIRINKLTLNNQKYYNLYLKYSNKGKQSIINYTSTILRYLEFINDDCIPINFNKIGEFLDTADTTSTYNNKKSYLKDFYVTIANNDTTINFNVDDFNRFIPKNKKEKKEKELLTIYEITKIKQFIEKEIYLKLAFDLAYIYGLSKDEISNFSFDKYDVAKKQYKINNEKKIIFSDELHQSLINQENNFLLKGSDAYSERYKKIGKLIGRNITWEDINKTREEYFMKCQLCNNKYENLSSNWVIIQYENDINCSGYLVCKHCAENNCYKE